MHSFLPEMPKSLFLLRKGGTSLAFSAAFPSFQFRVPQQPRFQCSAATHTAQHPAAPAPAFLLGKWKRNRVGGNPRSIPLPVLAVPAEPSCGDAAYISNNAELTHRPQNRGFFVTNEMISSSEKQGHRRKLPISVKPISTTGTNLHAAKYLLHNSRVIYNISHLDFKLKICFVSPLSNSLTMYISKHSKGKHVIKISGFCIGVGMMSEELGLSLSRIFFLFSH